MGQYNHSKYSAFSPVAMSTRKWPDACINKAPQWCSVDLRDGNQALIEPMSVSAKRRLFDLLVKVGFKQIEVGFPAAAQQEYDFLRQLIEEQAIPDDVTVQVLVQAREPLIRRTFEALRGAKQAIVHIYNSTSTVQREKVFKQDRQGIIDIAVNGAELVKSIAAEHPQTDWTFQYSPESFTGTELDFAADVCNAVTAVWQPTPEKPVIINLPATVEMSTPNVYADQIEWFCGHLQRRDAVIVSLHTHNDRGCAVAAAELGVMAGADRVEGTLLGNGERTGNMDIVTMGMNLYSQGVDPKLDFSIMDEIIHTVGDCTQIDVHPRHPYAGELVFTAFSGSHQDAINKCLAQQQQDQPWDVAYLPIDPADLGRSYQEVIRINSQSGKGGIAYVLGREYGIELPRWLQIDFSPMVQAAAEASEAEISAAAMYQLFSQHYLLANGNGDLHLEGYTLTRSEGEDKITVNLKRDQEVFIVEGHGKGAVGAFVKALESTLGSNIVIIEYSEHALSGSADAEAIAFIQLSIDGQRHCGAGISTDIVSASLKGIISAASRAQSGRTKAA